MRNSVQNNRGFTLIELLMVMAIIGALATMAISGFNAAKDKARISRATSEIRYLEKEIVAWSTEKGDLPTTLLQIGRKDFNKDTNIWEDMHDPWGRPYVYSRAIHRTYFGKLNTDYDLYSKGIDNLTADSIIDDESLDDVIRFDNGGFAGLANKYGI